MNAVNRFGFFVYSKFKTVSSTVVRDDKVDEHLI